MQEQPEEEVYRVKYWLKGVLEAFVPSLGTTSQHLDIFTNIEAH